MLFAALMAIGKGEYSVKLSSCGGDGLIAVAIVGEKEWSRDVETVVKIGCPGMVRLVKEFTAVESSVVFRKAVDLITQWLWCEG